MSWCASVTGFEALHKIGGVMVYGIPEFRLPKAILQAEVDQLAELGVEFRTRYVVGRTEMVDELLSRYNAVFIGTGAGLLYFMNVSSENLNGVFTGGDVASGSATVILAMGAGKKAAAAIHEDLR